MAGIGDGQAELVGEMVGERLLLGDEGLEIVVLGADRLARRRRRPALGRQRRRGLAGRLAVIVGEDVGEVGIEPRGDRLRIGLDAAFPSSRASRRRKPRAAVADGPSPPSRLARPASSRARSPPSSPSAALEQRIALQLGIDIGDQVEIGELQQLDRLHQLRRHHQRLALAKLELVRKCHYARLPRPETGPGICLSLSFVA